MTSQADQWSGKARSRSADRLSLASLATIVHNAARRIESPRAYASARIESPWAYAPMRIEAY